jgi:hypothetical protein
MFPCLYTNAPSAMSAASTFTDPFTDAPCAVGFVTLKAASQQVDKMAHILEHYLKTQHSPTSWAELLDHERDIYLGMLKKVRVEAVSLLGLLQHPSLDYFARRSDKSPSPALLLVGIIIATIDAEAELKQLFVFEHARAIHKYTELLERWITAAGECGYSPESEE